MVAVKIGFVFLCGCLMVNGANYFDAFQKELDKAVNEVTKIDKESGDVLANSLRISTTSQPEITTRAHASTTVPTTFIPKSTAAPNMNTTVRSTLPSTTAPITIRTEGTPSTTKIPMITSKTIQTTIGTTPPTKVSTTIASIVQSTVGTVKSTAAPSTTSSSKPSTKSSTQVTTTELPSEYSFWSNLFGLGKKPNEKANPPVNIMSRVTSTSLKLGSESFVNRTKLLAPDMGVEAQIPLPDLDPSLYETNDIKASGGYFKSLSNLVVRPSDIKFTNESSTTILVDIPMEIKNMEFGFNNYTAKVTFGSMGGTIKVKVPVNKISTKILITLSTTCTMTLDQVEIDDLSGLVTDVTRSCIMCRSGPVASAVEGTANKTIKLQMEKQLEDIFTKVIENSSQSVCLNFLTN